MGKKSKVLKQNECDWEGKLRCNAKKARKFGVWHNLVGLVAKYFEILLWVLSMEHSNQNKLKVVFLPSPSKPCSQKGPVLSLMFCYWCLNIPNNFIFELMVHK